MGVYSDVKTWIAPDKVSTIKVEDVNGDFHFAKRKKAGTWVNSNMHIAAWKAIKDEGAWNKYDWTIKSDIDAIFIPIRLRDKLGQVEVTDNGIYLENCKWEYYGFFGALEVISHDGVGTLINNLDDCKASLNYKEGQKSTGNQPWGEDLFVQRCMDLHGVDKVAAYDISTDASCQAYRPKDQRKNTKWKPDCATTKTAGIHHFKKPADYFKRPKEKHKVEARLRYYKDSWNSSLQKARRLFQKTKGKTQSGSPIALLQRQLEFITSKSPPIISNASRQLNVEFVEVNFCMRFAAHRDNECFVL